MCGIAGVMFKHGETGLSAGRALIDMLDGCQHRGPDSTRLCALRGCRSGPASAALPGPRRRRASAGSATTAPRARLRTSARRSRSTARRSWTTSGSATATGCVVRFSGDVQKLTYDMEHAATLISIGESLDIRKDVGGAHDVDEVFHVGEVAGTHGLGHVRLATESRSEARGGAPLLGDGALPTSRSSTMARSRTTGRCAAASSAGASSSTRTTTAN